MQKQIKIGEKEYLMKASAYTTFAYKDTTGRSLFKDIQKLSNINLDNEDEIESLYKYFFNSSRISFSFIYQSSQVIKNL